MYQLAITVETIELHVSEINGTDSRNSGNQTKHCPPHRVLSYAFYKQFDMTVAIAANEHCLVKGILVTLTI